MDYHRAMLRTIRNMRRSGVNTSATPVEIVIAVFYGLAEQAQVEATPSAEDMNEDGGDLR